MSWLAGADVPALRSWAELEILCSAVWGNLMEEGLYQKGNVRGELRRAVGEYRKLKIVQLSYEAALGMTPMSRAQITGGDPSAPTDIVAALANAARVEDNNGDGDGADGDNNNTDDEVGE